jgi:hypothetical protein
MMSDKDRTIVIGSPAQLVQPATRRSFMKLLGIGGSIVLLPSVFAACSDDDDDIVGGGGGTNTSVTLNLNNDIGIFNYAYALEQLEAAFYTQALASTAFASLSAADREMLADIQADEVIHRDFLRTALDTARIPDLAVNFGAAFASANSILTTARTFEDLGVAAYNGAGKYIANPNNLLMAGKIVSVEARHASALRDTLDTTGRSFADLAAIGLGAVAADGLDAALEPSAVLTAADPFITTTVTIGSQPTP